MSGLTRLPGEGCQVVLSQAPTLLAQNLRLPLITPTPDAASVFAETVSSPGSTAETEGERERDGGERGREGREGGRRSTTGRASKQEKYKKQADQWFVHDTVCASEAISWLLGRATRLRLDLPKRKDRWQG